MKKDLFLLKFIFAFILDFIFDTHNIYLYLSKFFPY